MDAAHFLVSGKVQGVGFRASTCGHARRLGLAACHATNLADGRVSVVAMGEAAALDALEDWLGHGPPSARVVQVLRAPADAAGVAPVFGIS